MKTEQENFKLEEKIDDNILDLFNQEEPLSKE